METTPHQAGAPATDEVVNPVTGQHLVFIRTAGETGGELLEMESVYRPNGYPPALHYHPIQRERFEVLEGTLRVILDGVVHDVDEGETLLIEPGTVHEMWNPGPTPTRVNWHVTPALKTEQLFRTTFGLAGDGKVNAKGIPNLLQVAVMARAYDQEFRLATPPRPVQRLLFGALGPIGRLRGYRATYDRYRPSVSATRVSSSPS